MRIVYLILVSLICFNPLMVLAKNNTTLPENTHSQSLSSITGVPQIAWLGIATDHVPPVLRDQLNQLIPTNQGILVTDIVTASPAEKAGLRQHDVLLSYDKQKLFSPSQLSGLVRSDQPARTVSLQVIQQGKLKVLQIQLGQRDSYRPQQFMPFGYRPFLRQMPQIGGNNNNSLAWDSFESVRVNTLPDGRYHAEVSFKNRDNETKSYTFEGKREEIIEQINKQGDLPQDKKNALLNALNMQPNEMFKDPFFQHDPFNMPFFQNKPFDRPFFQQFYRYPRVLPQIYTPGKNS